MLTPLDKAHQRLYKAMSARRAAEQEYSRFMEENPQGSAPGLRAQMAEYTEEERLATEEIGRLMQSGVRR